MVSTQRRSFRQLATYAGGSIFLLAACAPLGCDTSGGLDNVLPFGDPLAAYDKALTPDDAYHLLRRTAMGATPEEVDAAVANGLEKTVDDLLTIKPDDRGLKYLAQTYEDNIPKCWMVYLLHGANPLRERMAMFWHDRFATSRRVLQDQDRNLALQHWSMLRANALGNYRDFLEALTLDPLELIWLDGANSPKAHPNENYAREFWELFTLGRDVLYTEKDIRESSRAFTGISLLREDGVDPRPVFDIINHDETSKNIFADRAQPDNYNYKSVIALTLAQPEAAQYVARNLYKFFIHDHPTDEEVKALGDLFVASDFEIAPLVKKILMSAAFFSDDARNNLVTTPVEHIVGVARTFSMQMYSEDSQGYILDRLVDDLSEAGMELLNPPAVNGWDEGLAWMEDRWTLARVRGLGRTMEFGKDRNADLPYQLLPRRSGWTDPASRRAIVDQLASVFHLALTPEEEDIYVQVLDQGGHYAFYLTDQDNQIQLVEQVIRLMCMDERVLGS